MRKWIERSMRVLATSVIVFVAAGMAEEISAQIAVTGMTCSGCARAVERALLELDGVKAVKVNWKEGKVNVTYDDAKVTMRQIHTAIHEAGFGVAGEDAKKGCTSDRCSNGTKERRNGNRSRSRCCL